MLIEVAAGISGCFFGRLRAKMPLVYSASILDTSITPGTTEAPTEGTEFPLPADIAAFLVFLLGYIVVDCGNGKGIALEVDFNILFFKAGEFGFQEEIIPLVLNIAAELAYISEAGEEIFLHIVQVVEQVVVVCKRNHSKHNILLFSAPQFFMAVQRGCAGLALDCLCFLVSGKEFLNFGISSVPLGTIKSIPLFCYKHSKDHSKAGFFDGRS